MNKRERVLNLIDGGGTQGYVPAAFFLHFDPAYHQGQAAIDRHLEFFNFTGMDFVKIQYEQIQPPFAHIHQPRDWADVPLYGEDFFEAPIRVAEGLVNAAKDEALVIMTLYSPFMWAGHLAGPGILDSHLREDPEAVKKGLEIMVENVLNLVRGCKRAGIDGFYASSQGGEAFRFTGTDIFEQFIKPSDLAVWDEIGSCTFNILHICDYVGGYEDLTPFLDYPGQVVNCSLKSGERTLTPTEASKIFGRPYMGGMERTGVIAAGGPEEIRAAAEGALANAPERFILGADCTVPGDTPWEHLRIAIEAAHRHTS
jgi:uroporphyrinogen decarboxylase